MPELLNIFIYNRKQYSHTGPALLIIIQMMMIKKRFMGSSVLHINKMYY